jgi:FkbM family methyltransferase
MNLSALVDNFRRSLRICRTWPNRIGYLRWLYSRHSARASARRLTFSYPEPVGEITVMVRANRGSDAFIFSEVFDRQFYDFDLPRPPDTILDLGANIGFTSLFLARKYPHAIVACVEPVDGNARLLVQNLKINRLKAEIFQAAVGVADGQLAMSLDTHDYGHKVADIEFGKEVSGRSITVESVSIPTLLARLQWPRIGLLKIDIEGYEGVLLRDNCDWLWKVDALCIECHENYGEADLRTLAVAYDFTPPVPLRGMWLLARRAHPGKSPPCPP